MEDIVKLPYWGAGESAPEDDPAPKTKVRFPFKPEYNKLISLTTVDKVLKIDCDVIVVGSNESCDATDCFFDQIAQICGPEFRKAAKLCAPLKVTETRLLTPPTGKLGARNVMLMLPPRYNEKYVSAAINSLNKTYLNALQVSADNGNKTVLFTQLHDLEHKFDASKAAQVVVRTIRRFFEHYPTSMSKICLALDRHGMDEYTKQMKLYFPRSNKEAAEAEKQLPADVGNEWGEMVIESRSIRISSLPGMGGDDDSDYSDEEDQAPTAVGVERPESMEYSQRQANPDARTTEGINDPRSINYIPEGYVNGILGRSKTLDLTALEQAGFFMHCGMDSLSKMNVLMFIGVNYAKPTVTRDKVLPYIAKILDPIYFNPFTLVYVHCPQTNNAESMSWLHTMASSFPRRCMVNMRIAVLYPTFWLKTHLRINRLAGLRAIGDISYYDNLAALFRVIGRDAVRLPEDIIRADLSIQSVSHETKSSSSATPAARSAPEPSENDSL